MNLWHELIAGPSAAPPHSRSAAGEATARKLTLGLLVLALLPRALVAWRLVGVCDDAFYYLWMADAWDHGNFVGLDFLNINIFPVILLGLHRLGLDWITAGKLWGVLVSSAAVLPLFGLARRMFDLPTAIAACLIYAVHPDLIELGIEPIREPTFWCLFLATLYATWRGVHESSLGWMAAAGIGATLTIHTRLEGWLLVIPLAMWCAQRVVQKRSAWRRLAVGAVLWAAATPGFVLLFNVTVLRHHDRWEVGRMNEIVLVRNVALLQWKRLTGGRSAPAQQAAVPAVRSLVDKATDGNVSARLTPRAAAAICVRQLLRSLEIPTLLFLAIGGWILRRRMFRGDQAPLTIVTVILTVGIVARLIYVSDINGRYFLSAFLCVLPVAGAGLRWVIVQSTRLPDRLWRFAPAIAPAAIVVAVTLTGWGAAISSGHVRRESEAAFGDRLRTRLHEPANVLVDHGASRLGYLLHGDLPRIVFQSTPQLIEDELTRDLPDMLVILRRKRDPAYYEPIVAAAAKHGLNPARFPDLPEVGEDYIILTRKPHQVTAGKPPAGRLSGLPFPENAGRRL